MIALMVGCILQNTRTIPGRLNTWSLLVYGLYKLRSKTWPSKLEKTLWKMGSLLGKSTVAPSGIASTCGMKCLSFCTMRKRRVAAGRGGSPPAGSSHTTTSRKSRLRRTPGSCESVSTTLPFTLAHHTGTSHRQLKQIRQSQIIVIVEPNLTINIRGACSGNLRTEEYVGRQAVEEVRSVHPV